MPDEDDGRALRERVRALEQTVQEQQSTIEGLMPSRRAILAGGAGLVGGAALTGQASAQSAAGQVGTTSEPVDVEADTLNAQTVNTDSASVTNQLDAGSVNTTVIRNVSGVIEMAPSNAVSGVRILNLTISDDSVETIETAGFGLFMLSSRNESFGTGLISRSFNAVSLLATKDITNQGTGTLTGTTGPDSKLNISMDGNTAHIENRTGNQESWTVSLFGQ